MRYQPLGKTGLFVSELCLGTMTWGGGAASSRWEAIGTVGLDGVVDQLRRAVDAGVNFVDTADVYHEGRSEELLGQAISKLGLRRESLVVATKVRGRTGPGPNDIGLTRRHVLEGIDASLRRLGLDHVDLYQIHGVDVATPLEETLDALDDVVRAGKVRYVGFCNLPAWMAMKALALSERHGWARFVSAQVYVSIAGRDVERELVPLAQEEGLAILPWSPLAGGLLSGKFDPRQDPASGPADARRARFDFPPVDRARAGRCVDAMRPIATAHGTSVARVALAYLLARPYVTSVILGAKTVEQLDDNLAAVGLALSAEELAALDEASALPPEYPGWMVGFQNRDRFPEGAKRG